MKWTLIGMALTFISMLPSVPVRAWVPPRIQHLLAKAEWAFIITTMLLFAPYSSGDPLVFIEAYFAIVVVAPLIGLFVSMGVTVKLHGKMPTAWNPPTDDRYVDPLFDWSRDAIEYKFKRIMLPSGVGIIIAMLCYFLTLKLLA